MPSYVVETFVPGDARQRLEAEADGMRTASAGLDGHVTVVRSYFVPGDEMGFHVVEADTLEHAARAAALAGIEVERIVETIRVETGRRRTHRRKENLR
jgi:hypothetical protein